MNAFLPPRHRLLVAVLAVLASSVLATACGDHGHHAIPWPSADASEEAGEQAPVDEMTFEVPPPPFEDPDLWPCSQCHGPGELEPNPTRRTLTLLHAEIVLRHDEQHRWCLDCHDAENRDKLRLANGTLVDFTESYRLCGQCHGTQYRDWRAGVHGRRTGSWDGAKQYLLCVNCHNSHDPGFKPLAPLPRPRRPEEIR
jgi:hypothetical protein